MTLDVELRTRLGRIRGRQRAGVHAFVGVRFAEPPQRFRPPVPSGAWIGVYDATAPRARPMQGTTLFALVELPPVGCAEDCLFLDVYVPSTPSPTPRPVIFWVYGGALTNGSASEYDGSTLARLADAVVVCPNYRLGIFGAGDLRCLRSGGFARSPSLWLLDQIAALEWVRDNIADYGGDPGRVLAAGQSAGAVGVLALVAVGAAGGLITAAMANSPAFLTTDHSPLVDKLAAARGVSSDKALAYLLDATAEELIQLQDETPGLLAGAIADGTVLTAPLADLIRRRRPAVPLVTGFTRSEGAIVSALVRDAVPEPLVTFVAGVLASASVGGMAQVPAYLDRLRAVHPWTDSYELTELVGADVCRRSSIEHALATVEAGGTAWHYRMDVPCLVGGKPADSPHGCDVPFTFNWFADTATQHDGLLQIHHPGAPALADRWTAMIAQFVRTGDPNGPLGEWPAYDPDQRSTLLVSPEGCTVDHDLDPEYRTTIWPSA